MWTIDDHNCLICSEHGSQGQVLSCDQCNQGPSEPKAAEAKPEHHSEVEVQAGQRWVDPRQGELEIIAVDGERVTCRLPTGRISRRKLSSFTKTCTQIPDVWSAHGWRLEMESTLAAAKTATSASQAKIVDTQLKVLRTIREERGRDETKQMIAELAESLKKFSTQRAAADGFDRASTAVDFPLADEAARRAQREVN